MKLKKRKLRDGSKPQYVVVDDPNLILPKTRIKRSNSPTNSSKQTVYLMMQQVNPGNGKGSKHQQSSQVMIEAEGNQYKLTKLSSSIQLNKVVIAGKDANNNPQLLQKRGSKHHRKLIHNTSLKFSNKRSNNQSPSLFSA